MLSRPGMSGFAAPASSLPRPASRVGPLREIVLARALYRLGDHNGLAEKILRAYAKDPRGVLARHAAAVLEANRR